MLVARGRTIGRVAQVRRLVSRHYGWSQVAVVLGAVACYESIRLALPPDWSLAVAHARSVYAWERRMHIAWEAPLQRAFLGMPDLVRGMNVFYLAGNFVLTGGFFVWLYRRSEPGFRLYRNAFLIATAVSLLIEWRFPTAPPRLAGVGIEDTLRTLSGIDIGSSGSGGLTDPVAAVPSLHAGWALGVGAGVLWYSRSPLAKVAGFLYPPAVALSVVVTGNHFFFDAFTGMALLAASLGIASAIDRAEVVEFRPRRGVEQSGSSPGS
jgi:PAP2 superfamily